MVIPTLPTTAAYLYLPLPTYRCLLSSNGNGGSNIYLPTYPPTAAYLVAMAIVVVISTYLPNYLPTYLPLPT